MALNLAINTSILAIGHIIFGLLILIFPRFLRFYIGLYFLAIGALMLLFSA